MSTNPFGSGQDGASSRGTGFHWWIIIAFLLYAGWYWFSNREQSPYTGREQLIATGPQEEAALGLEAYKQVLTQSQVVSSGPEPARINAIAQRLEAMAPKVEADLAAEKGVKPHTDWSQFDWQVSVLQSDEVNAFCLPGGKMAVYTGLLPVAQNDDALAIVMGHEISHALLRHGAERMAQQHLAQMGQIATGMAAGNMDPQQQRMVMGAYGVVGQFGVLLPFSRKDESEADEIGLMLAAAACYNPEEAIPLWQRMEQQGNGQRQPEFMSTHPNPGNRISALQALMPRALAFRQKYCAGQAATPAH